MRAGACGRPSHRSIGPSVHFRPELTPSRPVGTVAGSGRAEPVGWRRRCPGHVIRTASRPPRSAPVGGTGAQAPRRRRHSAEQGRRFNDRARSQGRRPSSATADRAAHPGAPGPQRRRGERPSRRRRGSRCKRARAPRPGGSRSHRQPEVLRQAIWAHLADRGGRHRGLRARAGRARDHDQQPFRRGPSRPDAPGAVPPDRRLPGVAGLRLRGHAARRPDCSPPRPRRREGQPGPSHVLGPALRLPSALQAAGMGSGWLLARRAPRPGRLSRGRGPGVRHDSRPAPTRHRRLRDPHLWVPAPGGRPGVRIPGGPLGRAGRGRTSRDRGSHDDRSATRCWPIPSSWRAPAIASTRRS